MMKRRVPSIVVTWILAVLCLAGTAWAAEETVRQIQTPDGKSLWVTGVDVNQTEPAEGYHHDLRIFTPAFTGTIQLLGKTSTILVVEGNRVSQILTSQGATLPTAPAIPAGGYLVVGSGIGSSFLQRFKVGDPIAIVERARVTPDPAPTVVITLNGSQELSAINRGRGTRELILFTPDFGSHTFTNQYGCEVAVVDGVVVAKRPYGSTDLFEIPANGFVLSGHNVMGSWLDSNLNVGDLVELQ